jgi:hypothetical protein
MKTMKNLSDIFQPLFTPLEILKDNPIKELDPSKSYFVIASAVTSKPYVNKIRKILIREALGALVDAGISIVNFEDSFIDPGNLDLLGQDWVDFENSTGLIIIDGGFWKQSDTVKELIGKTQEDGDPVFVYTLDRLLRPEDWESIFKESDNV